MRQGKEKTHTTFFFASKERRNNAGWGEFHRTAKKMDPATLSALLLNKQSYVTFSEKQEVVRGFPELDSRENPFVTDTQGLLECLLSTKKE